MGVTLTSKTINSTYDSLLKLSDNDQLTGAFKVITDGLGNDTGISINNTNQVNIAGQLVVNSSITANSFVRSGGLSGQFLKADGSVDSNTYQSVHQKGLANGYPPLDSGAKIPELYLPDSIVGQLEYQGTWNASTNTPTLPSASTVKGHYYVVNVAGTYNTIEYAVGDWVISNGTSWEKVDNTDAVTTVFGRLGAIVANQNDYSSFYHPLNGDLAANASTATTLQTARFINGTSFNGSANITTANWGTSRTITIGDTGKSLNGSTNVAWSRAELGITKTNIDALNIDADTLDSLTSSQFLRSDADDNTGSEIKTYFGGAIMSSGARIQVNGFQRTGNIYLHSGGNIPNLTRDSDWLSNIAGDLHWSKDGIGTGKVFTSFNYSSYITKTYIDGLNVDADTLDGLTSTQFLRSDTADTSTGEILFDAGFKSDSILLSGAQNFDNISRSGFYNLYNTATGSTNAPPFPYGTMVVVGGAKTNSAFGLQIAHERLGTGMYVRGMNDTGSAWSSWAEIWTSTTDGSGSGLDADLLDGLQGTQFLRSDTSDTMSGTLNITGSLAIGKTTAPATTLDINGGILANGNIATSAGNISANYNISAGGYMSTSEYKIVGSTNNGRIISDSWGFKSQTDSGYIQFGPANSGFAHIYTDRSSFYFNKELLVNGATVWNSNNDGSGSGLDADLLDGLDSTQFLRSDTSGTLTGTLSVTGNLGIGTTSPSTKMHILQQSAGIASVYSSAIIEGTDAQLDITSSSAGTWGSAINLIEGIGSSNNNIWSIARTTSSGGNDLRFNFGTSNQQDNPTKVTFDSNGNVGIGDSNPAEKLTVISPALGTAINNSSTQALFVSPNVNQSQLYIQDYRTAAGADWNSTGKRIQEKIDSTWMGYMQFNGSGNNGGISFGTGLSTTQANIAERMRITSAGVVDISGGIVELNQNKIDGSSDNLKISADFGNVSGASTIEFLIDGSEKMRIDNAGRMILNGATSGTALSIRTLGSMDSLIRHEVSADPTGYYTLFGTNYSYAKSFVINNKGSEIVTYSDSASIGLGLDGGASNLIRFSTNASERMRIDSSGNVGIGTSTPNSGYKLDISGNLKASGNIVGGNFYNAGANYVFGLSTTEGEYINRTGNDIIVYAGGSARLTVDGDGGNVGIGTTSPSAKLDVIGTVRASAFGVEESSSSRIFAPGGGSYNGSGTQTGYLIVQLPNNGSSGVNNMMTGVIRVFDYATSESFDVHFAGYWYSGYNWTRCSVRIDSEANYNRNFTVRFGRDTATGTRPVITIGESNSDWSYLKINVISFTAGHSNSALAKWDDGWDCSISSTLPMTTLVAVSDTQVNNWKKNGQDVYYGSGTGNLGIGTDSPSKKLTVNSSTVNVGVKVISTDAGSTISFQDNTTNGDNVQVGALGDDMYFLSGGGERMRITSIGNVGIGTSSPLVKLNVNSGVPRTTNVKTYSTFVQTQDIDDFRVGLATAIKGGTTSADRYVSLEAASYQVSTGVFSGGIDMAINPLGGNVGIGTSSPAQKLQVNGIGEFAGAIRITETGTAQSILIGNQDSGGTNTPAMIMGVNGALRFGRGNSWSGEGGTFTEVFKVESNGVVYFNNNVGIGTTSPAYRLVVNKTNIATPALMIGGAFYGGPRIQTYGLDADPNAWMGLGTDMGVGSYEHSVYFPNHSNGKLTFGTYNGTVYDTKVTLLQNGFFGIGKSPDSPLVVYKSGDWWHTVIGNDYGQIRFGGQAGNGAVIQSRTQSGTARDLYLQRDGGNVGIGTTSPVVTLDVNGTVRTNAIFRGDTLNNSANTHNIIYRSGTSTFIAGGDKLVVQDGGNVGIGLTSPAATLDVNGTAQLRGETRLVNPMGAASNFDACQLVLDTTNTVDTNGWQGISFATSTALNYGWSVGANRSGSGRGSFRFYEHINSNTGVERFTIQQDGNVGIGDSTPSYKLDVNGTIRATGDIIAYSDARVKENVNTIENALDKVTQLRGVEYNKIGDDKQSIGVIAQEIEKVLPQVVQEDGEGMKSVAYGNIVGVLIEAIKEQQQQIDELKKRLDGCSK